MTTIDDVAAYLRGLKFHYVDEAELQVAIGSALEKKAWPFLREANLSRKDRIDFLLDVGIGIEVKIGGSAGRALEQLARYALSGEVDSLVLVTDRMQAGVQPEEIHGKPIQVVCLMGGLR